MAWARRPRRLTPLPWPSPRSSGAGSGSMCLEKSSSRERSAAASATASLKWASLWARNGRHPVVQALLSSQRSVTARTAHFFFHRDIMKNIKIDTSQPTVRALWVIHPRPIRPSGTWEVQQRHGDRPCCAQDRREPQRRRHACSTRFLIRDLSERALS